MAILFKINTHNYGRRKDELMQEALLEVLDNNYNPNLPLIPARDKAVCPIKCAKCGTSVWTQEFSTGMCDDCLSLMKMEAELSQKMFRMERELRMRELEEKLAET